MYRYLIDNMIFFVTIDGSDMPLDWGSTARDAWKKSADAIRKDMLEKFKQ
jgi:hypothetical protein